MIDARTSISMVETDPVWCALPVDRWVLTMSVCANVDGARVLTTMNVPRAVSGQLGSGSGLRRVLDRPCGRRIFAHLRRPEFLRPIP